MQTLKLKTDILFSWIKKNLTLSNLLILVLLGLLLFQRCENDSKFKRLANTLNEQSHVTETRFNELGEKISTVSVISFRDSELKILSEIDSRFKELDLRLKSNGRKIKDLQSSVSFSVESEGEQIVAKVDTIYRNKVLDNYFPGIPGWRYYDGVIDIKTSLRSDSTLLQSYHLKSLPLLVDVFAKNRFLKKPQFFADITSTNPKVSIAIEEAYIKKHPKAFLTFAIGVGGTITPDFQVKPGIQLGIYKPLYTIYK